MSNFQASQLNESLLTFDYNLLQQEIENTINADYIDDECFDDHYDVEMNDESEFDREVPITDKFDKIEVTPCVIIDNENDEEKIKRCNSVDKIRSIHNLIGSFEIDSNAVKEVGDEFERLGVCLRHLNYDQNTLHQPIKGEERIKATHSFSKGTIHNKRCLFCNQYKNFYTRGDACKKHLWNVCGRNIQVPCRGLFNCPAITLHPNLTSKPTNTQYVRYVCTDCFKLYGGHLHSRLGPGKRQVSCVDQNKHERDSKSSLELIAKWISNVALSSDNNEKDKLLNLLTKVIKDFKPKLSTISTETDSISISTESSDNQTIPNFFLLNVVFAVKKLNLNEYQEVNHPMFGEGQYIAEWIERFNDVFSTLLKDSESLKELIGTVQSERERMLMLYDEFVDDNTVSKHPRAVRDHKQALWKLVDEILQAFNDDIPEKSILFKEATQLTSGGYQLMFTCYDKGVGRLKKIVDQDIDMTQIRNTVGRRRKELVPLEVKDLGKLKSNYGEEMEIETNLEQDISINEINMEDQVPPIIEPSFSMQINEATKPVRKMVPNFLPSVVQNKCNEFVRSFIVRDVDNLPQGLSHDGLWKELAEQLANVTVGILETL
ncbi:5419_t:CDS:2 [Entrophospora sp. SA101]|nr:5419_t:CDS:2 [Entrophospora sp. SA101]